VNPHLPENLSLPEQNLGNPRVIRPAVQKLRVGVLGARKVILILGRCV